MQLNFLSNIKMVEYSRIDLSDGIDVNKTEGWREGNYLSLLLLSYSKSSILAKIGSKNINVLSMYER